MGVKKVIFLSQSFRSKTYRSLGWLRDTFNDTFKLLELVVIHGFIVYFFLSLLCEALLRM